MRTRTERAESSLNIARGAGLAVDLNASWRTFALEAVAHFKRQ